MPQPTSDSIPDLAQLHENKSLKDRTSIKGGNLSLCGPENRKWMCESMRPSLGTSMIVFAVPLLLPGITLTAVGFDEDSSFAKYGALHIIGMILLSLSGLLMLSGTFLNIRFHDKVSPEDAETQLVSTHEMKMTSSGQPQDMTVVSLEAKEAPDPSPAVLASFMVDAGHSSVRHTAHHVSFGGSQVGAKATLTSGRMLDGEESDLAQSPTSRDFQPHSILSSPRNTSLQTSVPHQYHGDLFPDALQSESTPVSASSYHFSTTQRELCKDNESEQVLMPEAGPSPQFPRKLPEITLKRPDRQSVALADNSNTESIAHDKVSSWAPAPSRSNKKTKRKKKKRSERLLSEGGDQNEPGGVSDTSNIMQFSTEDPTGFFRIDKKSMTSTHTLDSPIKDDIGLAYRPNINSPTQLKVGLLSIPKTVYNVANRESSDDSCDLNPVTRHSSASSVEDNEKGQEGIRKLPKRRRQREQKSDLPSVSPPSYSSLEDPPISGVLANLSDSVGTVTQLYTLDASHSSVGILH